MTNIRIPTPLRKFTNGESEVKGNGNTINEVINNLDEDYSGIKNRLLDEEGKIRKFLNIYVNGEDVRFLNGIDTKVNGSDEISIVPAVAGG